MRIDASIGGGVDAGDGGDPVELEAQVRRADELGYDAVWTAETSHDPFLPLLLASQYSDRLELGTAIAVAFARSPMTVAMTANDLQLLSGGRFILGLGSQIKPHIERRFNMPWSSPAARMREFVQALHAIWESWATGDRLNFKGDFYQHTLMTPMFSPGANPHGNPRIMIAAVGGLMTKTAAAVADGLLVHGFTTERYLREVTMPMVHDQLAVSERTAADFQVCYPGFVVTAAQEDQLVAASTAVRKQIAFYGSTPAYAGVLELHGWGELHTELNTMSKRGEWDEMTTLIDDEVLNTFAVVGEPAAVGAEVARRYGQIVDRFTLYAPYSMDEDVRQTVLDAIRATP